MRLHQTIKRIVKWVPAYVLPVLMVMFAWNYFMIPESLTLIEGQTYECATVLPVSTTVSDNGSKVTVKAFGVVTQKTIDVNVIPETKVTVSGKPIGVKMISKGVTVTGFVGFLSDESIFVTPARDCGLQNGDRILAVDGEEVDSAEALSQALNQGNGQTALLEAERKGQRITVSAHPCQEEKTGVYKLGLWVKDSVAGIGTLTFYSEDTGFYGALGHGITDTETGQTFRMSRGILLGADITGAVKGNPGLPGELKGIFLTGDINNGVIGNVLLNNERGIYGYLSRDAMAKLSGKEMLIGTSSMVEEGPATIIATVDDGGPRAYEAQIEKISMAKVGTTKGLVIRITDPELLKKTGGIVQGMSGSPIIQHDRLIGAVTHVMINDPASGYGVFIESMLANRTETSYGPAEQQELQAAS